jgi:hypothetical protein
MVAATDEADETPHYANVSQADPTDNGRQTVSAHGDSGDDFRVDTRAGLIAKRLDFVKKSPCTTRSRRISMLLHRTARSVCAGVLLAAAVGGLAGCASSVGDGAGGSAGSTSGCTDITGLTLPYSAGQPIGAGSATSNPDVGFNASLVAGQGNALIVSGQDKSSSIAESPARVARVDAFDGKVLKSIKLDPAALGLTSPMQSGSSGAVPFDSISQIAVGKKRIYLIWSRENGTDPSQDVHLLALDSCSLALKASQPIADPGGTGRLAYDPMSDTVWVPEYPTSGQVTGFNGITLQAERTASVDNVYSQGCIAALNGAIWYSRANGGISKIDAKTGSATIVIPDSLPSENCVQTDGTSLYIAQKSDLLAINDQGKSVKSYPLPSATVVGVANNQTWVATGNGIITSLSGKTSLKILSGSSPLFSFTSTAMNVWAADAYGRLYVL